MAVYIMQTQPNTREGEDRQIYSRNDPAIRGLRALQTREGRDRSGRFIIEGIRPLAEATALGARVEQLVVAPALLKGALGNRLIKQHRIGGTPCWRVTEELFHSLSQADEPQGVAAVVRQRWERLDQVRPGAGLCWVAVETIKSAGNLGTILRTSEAVGGAGVILIGDSVDPYEPATIRASMGALFHQKFVRTDAAAFAEWKRRRQCTVIGSSPSAEVEYNGIAYPGSLILLMGGEKKGLSAEMQSICDAMVKIPMVGRSDSLNVAIASAVLLYEVFQQRRAIPAFVGKHDC